jgi:enoyl-CoA hydratase
MSEQELVIEQDGAVATVRINRPEVHNALHSALLARLGAAIAELACGARAIVLTGTGGKAFCAGADLDELAGLTTEEAAPLLQAGQDVVRGIERSRVPVIAAVDGLALGGGFELALACSFTLVSTRAAFGLPEAGLGLIPGYGGTQRLARIVGPAVARHAMLTGHRIDAGRAHALGIAVLPPVEPDALLPLALDTARRVAAQGPAACRAILEAVDVGRDGPLDAGLVLESRLAAMVAGSAEAREGVAAFREKRPASYGGRG